MRKNIHPPYNKLSLKIGQDIFDTYSTLNTGHLLVETDWRKHIAWNKDAKMGANQSNKSISAFNKKFSGLSFGVKQ